MFRITDRIQPYLRACKHPNILTSPCMVCCRCFVTEEHLHVLGSDLHALVGPGLIKVTDLINTEFLQQPLHQANISYARATSLAGHLNLEVALLKKVGQHLAASSPFPHLEQDVQYTVLRSAQLSSCLLTCGQCKTPACVLTAAGAVGCSFVLVA